MIRVLVNLQNNALNHDSMLENKNFTLRSFLLAKLSEWLGEIQTGFKFKKRMFPARPHHNAAGRGPARGSSNLERIALERFRSKTQEKL